MASNAVQAVTDVAKGLLEVSPLAGALERPPSVGPTPAARSGADGTRPLRSRDPGFAQTLLDSLAEHLKSPRLAWRPGGVDRFSPFEHAITRRLAFDPDALDGESPDADPAALARAAAEGARSGSFLEAFPGHDVLAEDGVVLRAYTGGKPGGPCVVIASACGMPALLCERWMQFFALSGLVLTWESRGMSGRGAGAAAEAMDCGLAAQARDLVAVMDHFGVARAHLMGVCGGAVLALTAAGASPERFNSLGLWHGDFGMGGAAPRTAHQRDMLDLMSLASKGRAAAATLRASLEASLRASLRASRPPTGSSQQDSAHLTLYPYANANLLHAYGRLNRAIMEADLGLALPAVRHPTLVVTSEQDTTAHPDGSRQVAHRLARGSLHVLPHGDHLSVFGADKALTDLAGGFMRRQAAWLP